jgi:nitronate monooxygenase
LALKAKDEAGFSNLWAGQALRLGKEIGTYELTRELAKQTLAKLK